MNHKPVYRTAPATPDLLNIQMKYIGETKRTLKTRVCEHIGYINKKKLNEPAREDFNLIGHTKADIKVVVL